MSRKHAAFCALGYDRLALWLATVGWAISAPAAESSPRVAVVAPLDAAVPGDGQAPLGQWISDVLTIALADHKTLAVVDRERISDVLAEQKLTLARLVDPRQAARLGELLHADVVVSGSVVKTDVADRLRLAIHVVVVDGQQIVGSVERDVSRSSLDQALFDVATQIAQLAGTSLPKVLPDELDESPEGRLHLMRGISLYYANNPAAAIVHCLRAVQRDPRMLMARLWIARSYLSLGEPAHARAELERLAANPAAAPLQGEIKTLLTQCAPRCGKPANEAE